MVSPLIFPRAHRTRIGHDSRRILLLTPKDAEDDGKLPWEIYVVEYAFRFPFFFQFVPRFHPRISFPFSLPPPLSLSLFNLFSFAIERCYSAELRSIVKIIFQFGADWLPFNLTRFHCRTSLFARNMHTHLPILLDDFNFIEKKEKS